MSVVEVLFGKKLATKDAVGQKIGVLAGVSLLGLDALSSAAYGPEAALTVLMPLGRSGLRYIFPLSVAISALLMIVYFSYRQTISAYPGSGGSYTVAKENLGTAAGLTAAAGLAIDYVLNVAVAISAGVGALVSAVPALLPHTMALCLGVLFLLSIVNLRGVRASGLAWMAPTYLFLFCLFATIARGGHRALAGGPVAVPEFALTPKGAASPWLLLRAFASGCTAMTGVEAVSNGVANFRDPAVARARRTLGVIVGALAVLLLGVALLSQAYGITATPPGREGYRSLLSQIVEAVHGRGPWYYVTIAALIMVLTLSANTSFADFPRVCRLLAIDHFLPAAFGHRGRRLVFSLGIYVLGSLSAILLVLFGGVTDRLIPLFAVGAFLAFTLSQAGMVMHWWRQTGPAKWHSLVINAFGASCTGVALIVIFVSKFTEGAWLTILALPLAVVMFRRARRYHERLSAEMDLERPLDLSDLNRPIVIVPVRRWDRMAEKGLRLAFELSNDVRAVHVCTEDEEVEDLRSRWGYLVQAPAKRAGRSAPTLDVIPSTYREVSGPLLDYVARARKEHPDREIAVVLPELIERRWYHYLFRHHEPIVLKELLLFKGGPRVIVISTPWYWND